MAHIALFHSVLGIRPGIVDAAARLHAAGHEVLVVDQYGGATFDDYAEARAFADGIGFPELMRRAVAAAEPLPPPFIAAGFSNGAGMAEHVATRRDCAGVLLISGALPLAVMGGPGWPPRVPAQFHSTVGDPMRRQEWIDALAGEINAAGGRLEAYDYPGSGHLFTDPRLPDEYDPQASELLWQRALEFCGGVGQAAS